MMNPTGNNGHTYLVCTASLAARDVNSGELVTVLYTSYTYLINFDLCVQVAESHGPKLGINKLCIYFRPGYLICKQERKHPLFTLNNWI